MEFMRASEMVAKAKEQIEKLTVGQAAKEIGGGDVVVVDLREQNERELNGVIPGSVHAPRGMLEFWADPTSAFHRPEFDPNRRLILHCAAGGRSALATETLQRMGYTNVAHLEGGFTAWKAEGQPTVSAADLPGASAH
ncbi:MAG: rhodanese-like domain-containing protein [Ilumatobacteraceae bacterium]